MAERALVLVLVWLCGGSAERVLLLVVEGMTQALLNRVYTPAMDSLFSSGAVFHLRPEFPAETLPTLQAMMTGEHGEVTGVLGSEVRQDGFRLTAQDQDFWTYSPNTTTLWELTSALKDGWTGSVVWPGTEFWAGEWRTLRQWKWGIGLNTSTTTTTRTRVKRTAHGHKKPDKKIPTEQNFPAEPIDFVPLLPEEKETNGSGITDQFFFNKTTDKEWLVWCDQVRAAVGWLQDKPPANLVLFYLSQPGDKIRAFGPDSVEADLAVSKIDQLVSHLLESLTSAQLLDTVNLVVTGLHGFAEVSAEHVFDISNLVGSTDYVVYGHTPVLNLQPVDVNRELDIYAALQKGPLDKYDLYNKHGIPDRFHYKNNDRVTDIVLVAREGYAFGTTFYQDVKVLNQRENMSNLLSNKYGFAGYDNELESMQSFLLIRGPGVNQQMINPQQVRPLIYAVDVFSICCVLLGITPPPTTGSIKAARDYLVRPPSQTVQAIQHAFNYITQEKRLPVVGLVLGLAAVLVLMVCCCCLLSWRRRRQLGKDHNYRYSQMKANRKLETRVDGSEGDEDKIGLLTSALMQEEAMDSL